MLFKIKWKLHVMLIILTFLISLTLYESTRTIFKDNNILNSTAQNILSPEIKYGKVKVVIDKFEEKYVVCEKEDKSMINIKHSSIPSEAKEGDVLNIDGEHISIAIEETKERRNEIDKLSKDLWE